MSYFILEKREPLVEEDYGVKASNATFSIPRPNVAKFLIDVLQNEDWKRKMVAITMPK